MIIEDPNDQSTRVREADLTRHLENGKGAKPAADPNAPAPAVRTKPAAVVPGEQKPTELGSKDDFQLAQAIAFLKGEPVKGVQTPTPENTKPAGASPSKN